jgi:hypothetical protein
VAAFTTAVLVAAVGVSPAAASDGDHGYTCHGGSIPAGVYRSLQVAGPCSLDAGNVTVNGEVTVLKGGALIAAFGGSNLRRSQKYRHSASKSSGSMC